MNDRRFLEITFDPNGQFPMQWQLELTPGQITRLKNAVQTEIEKIRGEMPAGTMVV